MLRLADWHWVTQFSTGPQGWVGCKFCLLKQNCICIDLQDYYSWWKKYCTQPWYWFIHLRWCRISFISSTTKTRWHIHTITLMWAYIAWETTMQTMQIYFLYLQTVDRSCIEANKDHCSICKHLSSIQLEAIRGCFGFHLNSNLSNGICSNFWKYRNNQKTKSDPHWRIMLDHQVPDMLFFQEHPPWN